MTEHFSFFDSVLDENGLKDRDYNAQEFTNYFRRLVTTGLMKGADHELKVATSGSNMVTTIDTGVAFLVGRYYENDALHPHTHDTESLGKNRIDRIVIRMDLNTDARHVKSFIKKGVASASPVAPVLTQTPNVYEISLAEVKVIGGQTFINKVDVTDERGKDVICPWAGSNILPHFNDAALADLVNKVENMYTLTDGPKLHVYNGDLNNLNDAGIYAISSNAPNRPNPDPGVPIDYAIMVMPYSTSSTTQIGFPTSRTDANIMKRIRIGASWGPWFPAVTLNNTLTSTSTTEAATANMVKTLNDMKANRVQEQSFNATLLNGWTGTVTIFKDNFGIVHVNGYLNGGSTAANTSLFILPNKYIPLRNTLFPGISKRPDIPLMIQVDTSGVVVVNGSPGAEVAMYLAFRT